MSSKPIGGVLASAVLVLLLGAPAAAEGGTPADLCLELVPDSVSEDEWSAVTAAVSEVPAGRPSLFPEPWVVGAAPLRLDMWGRHTGHTVGSGDSCLEPGAEWTARFGRDFLLAGAELMLDEAPTTPGIDSSVTIEWYPEETRLRTRLEFAGPLGIPNGTCWVDDTLTIDESTSTVTASGEQGLETSLFAEGACGRFFDHLPDGGAGEQAVMLLPPVVELPGGDSLIFVAEEVTVSEDAVVVAGSLDRS